ncbi:MAG: alpha-glucosidase [Anaerolineae bacterium]|nr:alpha-glucosidase [Anaerolineae bacterium]
MNKPWWETAVFYQIYPRSFADANGDGIGDIPGIISKLDYLQSLGIDAIWLSPHYPSPQMDVGYDIADYTAVNPEYGTLDDFKMFLDQAHQRGIRVILDMVLNHTSHEHQWFIDSSSSRDNPKRDWYIWRDGIGDAPPNNWESVFGGSAWEYDERTGQYYYHHFAKWQPDLNWRNPEVKAAMFDACRFWLELGVDGFRLDALATLLEHPDLPNHRCPMSGKELLNQVAPIYMGTATPEMMEQAQEIFSNFDILFEYQVNQPGIHDVFKELRALVDQYPERMLIGETSEVEYYGNGRDELHMTFNFPLIEADGLTPEILRKNQAMRHAAIPAGGWDANTFNNHDGTRLRSRYANTGHEWEYARFALALLVTLKGTPFLYNGEEIGMDNLVLTHVEDFRDLVGLYYYNLMRSELNLPKEEAEVMAARFSRDVCRTPMQWRNAPNAGFSPAGVKTWLPINSNYAAGINVAEQLDNPDSHLNLYRKLIHLRKRTPALVSGDYRPLLEDDPDIYAFIRELPSPASACLVCLNMSAETREISCPVLAKGLKTLYSSKEGNQFTETGAGTILLQPYEILITEIIK